jgi:hypothetical protein
MASKEYHKAYCEANKEKIKNQRKAYREANREKIAEYDKAYREAKKEKIKAYREANKEKAKVVRKKYVEANKEKIKASLKAYYEANKERIKARDKSYHEDNKERVLLVAKAYREANKEKIRDWYKSNKAKVYAYCVKRRALKMNQYEKLSADDKFVIEECYELSQLRTKRMGFAWHVDHIIPLSKGGLHKPTNLQVVPATWNLQKNNNHQEKWIGKD